MASSVSTIAVASAAMTGAGGGGKAGAENNTEVVCDMVEKGVV